MIMADTLKMLTTMGPYALGKVLDISGYRDCKFKSATFLGMTNGGEFCYSVTFFDQNTGEDAQGKVFVKYNTADNRVTADF